MKTIQMLLFVACSCVAQVASSAGPDVATELDRFSFILDQVYGEREPSAVVKARVTALCMQWSLSEKDRRTLEALAIQYGDRKKALKQEAGELFRLSRDAASKRSAELNNEAKLVVNEFRAALIVQLSQSGGAAILRITAAK
jgi:hypothetical protein